MHAPQTPPGPHPSSATQFVYHAIHRYPARLDAMLLALTRRYLAATPVRC